MKKVFYLLIGLFTITINYCNAQIKYYIVFCAKNPSISEVSVGHAFVAFGKEDYNKNVSITDGAWGLVPDNKLLGGASILIGPVDGHIANDFLTQIDHRLIVTVNKDQYENALNIKKQWESKNAYQLTKNDCITFLSSIASSINLKIPDRGKYNTDLPSDFLQKLININSDNNSFTDNRDGKTYKIVKIGNQTWMAENLNYNTSNSWCNQCETYGRLYTYDAAKNACPSGWHLPSDEEWTTLTNYLGGADAAGGKLKSTSNWTSPNTGATNNSGFSALPGGYRTDDGTFYYIGYFGYWWSSTEYATDYAWRRLMGYDNSNVDRYSYSKTNGFSVRCVRD